MLTLSSVGQNSSQAGQRITVMFILNDVLDTSHFDLYAARCLFALDDRSEGGGCELFQQVRNSVINNAKTRLVSAPKPNPSPPHTVR